MLLFHRLINPFLDPVIRSLLVCQVDADVPTYLDPMQSYMRVTVQNNDTTAGNFFNIDNTGASMISRYDSFHSGNSIDSIIQYNALFSYIVDAQLCLVTVHQFYYEVGRTSRRKNPDRHSTAWIHLDARGWLKFTSFTTKWV